jgi:hypothetical protein
MKITSVPKIVEAVERFVKDPSGLEMYIRNAKNDRRNYGAEPVADFLWDIIKEEILPRFAVFP